MKLQKVINVYYYLFNHALYRLISNLVLAVYRVDLSESYGFTILFNTSFKFLYSLSDFILE